jgi:hypothetical protein
MGYENNSAEYLETIGTLIRKIMENQNIKSSSTIFIARGKETLGAIQQLNLLNPAKIILVDPEFNFPWSIDGNKSIDVFDSLKQYDGELKIIHTHGSLNSNLKNFKKIEYLLVEIDQIDSAIENEIMIKNES